MEPQQPKAPAKKGPARRLTAEFVVIFLSIVVALLADDWRESRNERAEGLDALALILVDVEADRDDLEQFRGRLAEQEQAARDLHRLIEEGGTVEALETAYRGTVLYWNYEPSHPAYRGLTQSGGLRLIDDPEVRRFVVGYNEETVPYIAGLRDSLESAADRLYAGPGARHFGRIPVADGGWRFTMLSTVEELRADREFISALGATGATARWLGLRIETLVIPLNQEVDEVLRAHLAAAGR